MTTVVELIVLSYTKLGDNSIVLHTLSEAYGRRGFVVRVGKGASMALFLPLNIVEAEIVENPKSTLWRARNFVSRTPLNGIRNNLYKNTMTLFMSEVLYRAVKDGANEEGLFDWCVRSLVTLDALPADFSNFHIRFLLELAGALGFRPSFDDIAPFAQSELPLLQQFLNADFSASMLIPLNGNARTALAEDLLRYLEFHTESRLDIRSLPVLHELFR